MTSNTGGPPFRPQTNGKVERFRRTLTDGRAYSRLYRSDAERCEFIVWPPTYNDYCGHTVLGGQPSVSCIPNLSGHAHLTGGDVELCSIDEFADSAAIQVIWSRNSWVSRVRLMDLRPCSMTSSPPICAKTSAGNTILETKATATSNTLPLSCPTGSRFAAQREQYPQRVVQRSEMTSGTDATRRGRRGAADVLALQKAETLSVELRMRRSGSDIFGGASSPIHSGAQPLVAALW